MFKNFYKVFKEEIRITLNEFWFFILLCFNISAWGSLQILEYDTAVRFVCLFFPLLVFFDALLVTLTHIEG